MNWAKTVVIVV